MTRSKKPGLDDDELQKTSVAFPAQLWREFRAEAVRAGKNGSELLIELMRAHVKAAKGGRP